MNGIMPSFPTSASATRRRPTVVLVALGGVLLATGPVGCRRSGTAPPRHATDKTRRNVLLISIDTTRADALGCYGNAAIRTPNIDRLAAEGTLFAQCVSAAPITLPSHTSMMTGTYPFVHGVRDNGQFFVAPGNVTLAERLHDAGYATAAQVAAYVLNREFGLDQGFDTYQDVQAARRATIGNAARTAHERKARDVCDAAMTWLRGPGRASTPFFLFVHFFDPHRSYAPPPRFAARYDNPYFGEVAYVDEQIGRLLDLLDELKLTEDTLVVLTSDHGEGLGEHGEDTHATFVYDTTLLVPLIVRAPGLVPAGQRIAAQVRLIDLAPTILDALGLPGEQAMQGTSLLPLVRGQCGDLHLPAYSETLYPMYNLGCAWSRSWRHDGWKYIHAASPALYHVAEDPHELHNLADRDPQRVSRMRAALRSLLAEARPVAAGARRSMNPKELRALEALGYVAPAEQDTRPDRGGELAMFDPTGPDPHQFREENRLMAAAIEAMAADDYAKAEGILRKLLGRPGREATFWWAHKTLAEVLRGLDRGSEAIAEYRAALRLRPGDGLTRTDLGRTLAALGRYDEALGEFEQALRSPPVFADTHYEYGRLLALLGRRHEALDQQRAAVRLDNEYAPAWAQIGHLLARMQRFDDARAAFEKALHFAPRDASIRARYAQFLLSRDQNEQAEAQFRKVIEQTPEDARAWGGLAVALEQLGHPDEAEAALREAIGRDPELAQAWQALGRVLIAQRKYAAARQVLRQGRRHAPADAGIKTLLALLLAAAPDDAARDAAQALRLAQQARRSPGGTDPRTLEALAAALAAQGRFGEAAQAVSEAIDLVKFARDTELLARLRHEKALYEAGKPYRLP